MAQTAQAQIVTVKPVEVAPAEAIAREQPLAVDRAPFAAKCSAMERPRAADRVTIVKACFVTAELPAAMRLRVHRFACKTRIPHSRTSAVPKIRFL